MTIPELSHWAEYVKAVSLLGAAFVAGASWVSRRANKLLLTKMTEVHKQLSPNSGSSLHDAVVRIRDRVEILITGHRFILSMGQEATWECDVNGACRWASPQLCEMFGLSLDEMLGQGWLSAIDGQTERARVRREWEEAVAGNIPYQVEYRIVNKRTHERVMVKSTSFPCRVDDKVLWFYGTCEKTYAFRTLETEVNPDVAATVFKQLP